MKNIGFIGLGLMGKPMANHFLNKKYNIFSKGKQFKECFIFI